MASEIAEITDSNHDDIACYLDHILADLHKALEMLRDQGLILERHDTLLREFEPIIGQYRTPLAAAMTARRNRRLSNGRE